MKTSKQIFLFLFCLAFLSNVLIAQSSKSMKLLGNYGKGEGESKAVFAAGSLVYYGLGNKVQIVSYSNPATPVKVSSVIVSDVVEDLVRTSIGSNQYIVASGGNFMWLVNVQNPTTPSLVSTVTVTSSSTCEGIATSGSYAYVAAGGAGFKVYNIATPATPTLVSSIDSLAYCESVVISGQYAYIAAGSRSHIVDITNPAAPKYVGRIAAYGGYHQYLNVRSGYAYVCNFDAGLAVVNIANPAAPVNVVALPTGFRTARIVFDGNYGYVAVGDTGMVVYNLTNPAAPTVASKIKTQGRAASVYYGAVTIGGNPTGHIFVSNRNPAPGVSAINVANPAAPTTSSFLAALAAPTGTAYTPFYLNGKVFVAYGTAGLRIIDVSVPANATLLSTANLGGDSRAVVASGNYAYVAARDSGVYVVDVTNPALPKKIKTIKTARARGIAIAGTKVYVAASDSGMGVIDITNPAAASLIKYTGKAVYGENVAAIGNTAGLTDYGAITFYDVTNPAAPVKKGTTAKFKTGNEGFAISGNFAYVPDGDSLKAFNITNLSAPTLTSKIFTGGYGYTAFIDGKYCYVASEGTGVRAINITNPASLKEDGFYDGVPQSRGVTAYNGYVYVAEKTDGLAIYSNDLVVSIEDEENIPAAFALEQNYPNPFNPETNIRYKLSMAGKVSLKVFDLLGKEVATLINEFQQAGSYKVKLSAQNYKLASGVYFYTLSAGNFVQTKKMMYLK